MQRALNYILPYGAVVIAVLGVLNAWSAAFVYLNPNESFVTDAGVLISAALLLATGALAYKWRTANEALRYNIRERDVMAEHAPAAIAHVGRIGESLQYRFVNRRYAELYGRTQADVIGRHPRDVLGQTVYAQASANMQKALSGETVAFDLDLKSPEGVARAVHVKYAPDLDAAGKSVGFIGVISDITEQRRAERELRGLQAQLAAMKTKS